MKTCPRCQQSLPLLDFPIARRMKDGHFTYCKPCSREMSNRYYRESGGKEKKKALHKRRYPANRDKILKATTAYGKTEAGKAVKRASFKKMVASGKWAAIIAKWRKNNSHYDGKASDAVRNELRRGRMTRPQSCSRCGVECKPQAHHHNGYEREHWLDVVWLCPKCHHAANRTEAA